MVRTSYISMKWCPY